VKNKLSSGKIILLVILGILLAAALTLALTDLVRNVLAEPITHILYFFGLLVKSTPQVIFWGLLLLFLLVVAGKSVQESRRSELPEFAAPLRSLKHERIAFWGNHINMALRGDHYSSTRLAELLAGMVIELCAQEERVSAIEVRQQLERGELDLPPEIENYLKARFTQGTIARPSFWQRIEDKLARFWNSFPGKNNLDPGALPDHLTRQELERIIHYLEGRLEVEHDG
jgi:hypothetical protein